MGETTELVIRQRQRLAPCWQGEVVLPLVFHSAGSFDRAIDEWHQIFGLPDAARDESPYFELDYRYQDAEGQRQGVSDSVQGLGDIQMSIQRSLGCLATADALASEAIARVGIKLPTGSASSLLGSGKTDIYADIQSPVYAFGDHWRLGATIGVLLTGETDRFAPQKNLLAYGAFGSQFRLRPRVRLLAQLDWHTPFYDSELRELGDATVSISFGLRYLAARDQSLELTISEDAAIDTAPDIVARLAWTYRPTIGTGGSTANDTD